MSTNKTRSSNTKSKKVPIIIGAVFLLIVAIAVIVFMNTGKPGEENEAGVDNENTATAELTGTLEYGEDISDKTLTINNSDGVHEVSFADLTPEIDTMILGKTEHQVELDDEVYDVIVTVEDTMKPTISGVEPVVTIETEDEDVNVENELKETITAEDPVDGELEVTFEIEQKENREFEYNVTATAEDNNGNKTVETFEVVVAIVAAEVEEDEKEDKEVASAPSGGDGSYDSGEPSNSSSSSNSNNSSSSSASSSDSGSTTTTPEKKPTPKPKPEKKPEPKPTPKPKPEKKPEPKPEKKPEPVVVPEKGPKLPAPKNVPPGASLIGDYGDEKEYSYNRSFDTGGGITLVIIDGIYNTISMSGTDNNGNAFVADYVPSQDRLVFVMGNPKVTEADVRIMYEIGKAFGAAYSM